MTKFNASYRKALVSRRDKLIEASILAEDPVWRPLTVREIADFFDVSVQSLANWRIRGNGPPSSLTHKGKRRVYHLNEVLAWISGIPSWEITRKWMVTHGIVPDDASKEDVEWVLSLLDR